MYQFFFRQPTSTDLTLAKYRELCKEGLSKKRKTQVLLVVVALCLLIHCLSVLILGIILEFEHGKEANCDGYVYEHHTVYWIMSAAQYLHEVAIRLVIFLATGCSANTFLGVGPTLAMPPPTGCYVTPPGVYYTHHLRCLEASPF